MRSPGASRRSTSRPTARARAQIGVVAAVYPAVWGAGQLLTGWLSDHTGRKPLIVAGMLTQAGALALLVAGRRRLRTRAGAAVLLGIGTALVYPTLIAAVSDAVQPVERRRSWASTASGATSASSSARSWPVCRRRGRLGPGDRDRGRPDGGERGVGRLHALGRAGSLGRPPGDPPERRRAPRRARGPRIEPRAHARAGLRSAARRGADHRPALERRPPRTGVVPGSIHIPRSVLEWRVDPDCEFRNPAACDLEREVILMCRPSPAPPLPGFPPPPLGASAGGGGGFRFPKRREHVGPTPTAIFVVADGSDAGRKFTTQSSQHCSVLRCLCAS